MTSQTTIRRTIRPTQALRWAKLAAAAAGLVGGVLVLASTGGCAASDPASRRQADAKDRLDAQRAQDEAQAKPAGTGSSAVAEPSPTAKTHFAAGQVAEEQGDLDRAIAQYQAALSTDPGYQPALFRLGQAQTASHQYEAATATWHRYVTATGGSAVAYADLGLCLEIAGRAGEADTAFRAGVAADPRNAECRTNYGLMLARAGNLDPAAAQLAVVMPPADVQYNLASVLQSQGKIDEAKARYKQAILLNPTMSDAKLRLASIE